MMPVWPASEVFQLSGEFAVGGPHWLSRYAERSATLKKYQSPLAPETVLPFMYGILQPLSFNAYDIRTAQEFVNAPLFPFRPTFPPILSQIDVLPGGCSAVGYTSGVG